MKHPGMFVFLQKFVIKKKQSEFLLGQAPSSLPLALPACGSFDFILGFSAAQAMEAGAGDCTGLDWGELLHWRVGAGSPRQTPKPWAHLKSGISSSSHSWHLPKGKCCRAEKYPRFPRGAGLNSSTPAGSGGCARVYTCVFKSLCS